MFDNHPRIIKKHFSSACRNTKQAKTENFLYYIIYYTTYFDSGQVLKRCFFYKDEKTAKCECILLFLDVLAASLSTGNIDCCTVDVC